MEPGAETGKESSEKGSEHVYSPEVGGSGTQIELMVIEESQGNADGRVE